MFYTCGYEYYVLCITCTEKMGIKGNKKHYNLFWFGSILWLKSDIMEIGLYMGS